MGLHPAPSNRRSPQDPSSVRLIADSVSRLSNASAMAPALNEPLTQVQIPLSNSDSAGSASPRPGLLANHHHLIHNNNNSSSHLNHSAKESTPKIASPSQPIHLQLPRISPYSSNGYAKPSFQLAFVQQISTTNGPAPSTGLSPVQHHMDHNISPVPTTNHQDSSTAPQNDPVATTASPSVLSPFINHHTPPPNNHKHHEHLSHDLDLSDTNLDLEDVDESTNELINHTLRTPNHQLSLDHNSSDSPNNNNTMGLQKDYLKDNTDMEQMLGELANTSDLDLLQVFKSLAPSGSDNLCDLASGLALFNDVDVMNIGLEDVSTPIKEPDTQDIRNEIKKRHTQMMRKCDFLMRRLRKLQTSAMSEHIGEEVGGIFDYSQKLLKRKDRESKSISTVRQSNQSYVDQRADDSADDFSTWIGRLDAVATEQQCVLKKTGVKCMSDVSGVVASSSLAASTRQKGLAAVPLTRLVPVFDSAFSGQIELAAGQLQTELNLVAEAIDSDATASSSGGESGDEFSAYTKQQAVQQQLQNPELQTIENEKIWVFNGERMVRKYKTKKIKKQELERAKRAATRWARDRASIASRWSWLLAQISDLEYRIRQHSELHQQIKKNKGAVRFEDDGPMTLSSGSTPAATLTSTSTFDALATSSQSVNGYRGVLPGNSTLGHKITSDIDEAFPSTNCGRSSTSADFGGAAEDGSPSVDGLASGGACRTRAFQRIEFRKRKLLQTTNLHTISKKAAKQSTVKCGCQWPLYPCALCTGRPDPTAPRDLPDMLAPTERIGLLDPGFHPVISFASDTSHGISIEAVLRQTEFQTKAYRATSKAVIRGALALQKALKKDDRANRKQANLAATGTKRKYNVVANKLKKKSKKNNTSTPQNKYKRISSGANFGDMSASTHLYGEHFEYGPNGAMLPRSKNTSPTPTSSGHHRFTSNIDRKPRSSYDIDNIVIPYSVAASTRVEVLQCKEIPTPKWRTIENDSDCKVAEQTVAVPTAEANPDEIADENEDITTDAIHKRHESALGDERKKFSTYLKFPWSTRSRANRRIDSRAESSGTNTPDPTSPAGKAPPANGADREAVPSPATPSTPIYPTPETSADASAKPETQLAAVSSNGTMIHPSSARRRTVSKRTSTSESMDHGEMLPPYDSREFPLHENVIEHMLRMMPDVHQDIIDKCIQQHQIEQKATTNINRKSISSLASTEQPETICKTDYDFENFIGASSLSGLPFNLPDAGSHVLRDTDEETESVESGLLDEDPNDPEWCEEPIGRL